MCHILKCILLHSKYTHGCRHLHALRSDPHVQASWLLQNHRSAALPLALHMQGVEEHQLLPLVQALLAMGASTKCATVIGNDPKIQDRPPLFTACHKGYASIVQALLGAGAEVDSDAEDYRTPLHAASKQGHNGVVQLLIAAGASVEATDLDAQTPLHLAATAGHHDIVVALAP
jgi:hypothetical protein